MTSSENSKEVNIKSSTLEKSIDIVKDFLGKLINPTVEEVGLLFSEKVKYYRFKNQVNILLKAKGYAEKKGISVKEISTKILVPLLENASLEDDEELQDKWANMLTNMVDSSTNLQSQIFPFLLSQISLEEFNGLRILLSKEDSFTERKKYLSDLRANRAVPTTAGEQMKLYNEINETEQAGFLFDLEPFEYANLERLGIIRRLPPPVLIEEFSTGGSEYGGEEWHSVGAEYDHDVNGYRLTELGKKFLDICELS